MPFKVWNEYLNSKGKVEDGKVDISGDRTDPMKSPDSPPGTQGHKPYSASDGKTIKKEKEKGFGDQGDKDLIFNFDPLGDGKAPAKIPTAEQHNFLMTVREKLKKDPSLMENLVRDLQRNGMLGLLVGEMMEHRETYNHIAGLMAHKTYGESVCDKLAVAMIKEEVAPPFSKANPDEDLDSPLMDDDDDAEVGDEEGTDDDMDMFGGDEEQMPPEGMEGMMGGEQMPPEGMEGMMGGEEMPPEGMEGMMGGEQMPPEGMMGQMPDPKRAQNNAVFNMNKSFMKYI